MSIRFEIKHNGEIVSVSGIEGDGVFGAHVDYLKHKNKDFNLRMHIGGLGHYNPDSDDQQHARWQSPKIEIGDVIEIKILPGGEFEYPANVLSSPSTRIEHELFGSIAYNTTAWDSNVEFPHPPFATSHLHIWAPETGPTTAQEELFLDFKQRFEEIWPRMIEALLKCHDKITTVEELIDKIDSRVNFNIPDSGTQLNVQFEFAGDEQFKSYHITWRDDEIVEIGSGH